jgi:hypothetical protein
MSRSESNQERAQKEWNCFVAKIRRLFKLGWIRSSQIQLSRFIPEHSVRIWLAQANF